MPRVEHDAIAFAPKISKFEDKMKRVKLFLKGVCMGVADIIPGVSGGTLALILGIYEELVNTIRGLHLRWLPAVWAWIRGGFQREDIDPIAEAWEQMNLTFLVVLVSGISLAVAIGGMTLPTLLERYPEIMRALFFGLILASVWIPFRMITIRRWQTWLVVGLAAIIGFGAAWTATAPHRIYQAGTNWVELIAEEGETFKDINRRGLASWPGEQVYWAEENAPLRAAIEASEQDVELLRPESTDIIDPDTVGERSEQYEDLEIAAGTPVKIPQPLPWYIFIAGMVMVCAMILPGISGSYLLLIMGVYYFMLNALRAVLTAVPAMAIPWNAVLYVVVFNAGALIGILSFARVMSYFLERYTVPTVGVLVGLMVGGLRGIWPFRQIVDGQMVNVMPATMDSTVLAVIGAGLVGAVVVTTLTWLGNGQKEKSGSAA